MGDQKDYAIRAKSVVEVLMLLVKLKGGAGSGNYGHVGRPGQIGGSASKGSFGAMRPPSDKAESLENDFDALDGGLPYGEHWQKPSEATTIALKQNMAANIAAESGVPEDEVQAMIKQWATSSNGSEEALAIQQSIAEEFGLSLSQWQQDRIATMKLDGLNPQVNSSPNQKAAMRAMYNQTQEHFNKMGYEPDDEISLFRGVAINNPVGNGLALDKNVTWKGNTAESWSVSRYEAHLFAPADGSVVVQAKVPVRNILSTAVTGFGCIREGECVVFGTVPGSMVNIVELYKGKVAND